MESLVKLSAVFLLLAVVTAIWLVVNYRSTSSKYRISFGLAILLVFMVLLVSILAWKW